MQMPDGGFIRREQLEDWLNTLPDAKKVVFSRVIASRVFLRYLPGINDALIDKTPAETWRKNLIMTCFRAAIIARVASKCEQRFIEGPLLGAAAAIMLASNRVAMRNLPPSDITHARALAPAAAATASRASDPVFCVGSAAAFGWLAMGESLLQPVPWPFVTADLQALANGIPAVEVTNFPLFSRGVTGPRFDREKYARLAPAYLVWIDWLEALESGKVPWGLTRFQADAIEERIALGDGKGEFGDMFWKRSHDRISSDILEWISAAKTVH